MFYAYHELNNFIPCIYSYINWYEYNIYTVVHLYSRTTTADIYSIVGIRQAVGKRAMGFGWALCGIKAVGKRFDACAP